MFVTVLQGALFWK